MEAPPPARRAAGPQNILDRPLETTRTQNTTDREAEHQTASWIIEHCTELLGRHPERPGAQTLVQVTVGEEHRQHLRRSDVRLLHHTETGNLLISAPLGGTTGRLLLSWTSRNRHLEHTETRITRHIPARDLWADLNADHNEREAVLEIYHTLRNDGSDPVSAFQAAMLL